MENKVILGDCLEVMKHIPDKSIDLTVTSPPYDNLRTYEGSLNWSFEIFQDIAKELFRVTKDGGVIVWVVGDETKNFCESLQSFNQAIYFKNIGFNVLDTMIYYKQNYAPAYPTLKRYANQFEYMFIISKGKPNKFNPIQKEKIEHHNGKTKFRKADGTKTHKYIVSNKLTKDASNVWSYAMGNKTVQHPAVFPLQLATDHIISWSNENDTILDPFAGSGTTGIACINTSRNYILIEKEEKYFNIINKRIAEHTEQQTLFAI
jgi:site-specific DNA-methyltransferase (adenine-specific)